MLGEILFQFLAGGDITPAAHLITGADRNEQGPVPIGRITVLQASSVLGMPRPFIIRDESDFGSTQIIHQQVAR